MVDNDDSVIRVAYHCTHVRITFSSRINYSRCDIGPKLSLQMHLQRASGVSFSPAALAIDLPLFR